MPLKRVVLSAMLLGVSACQSSTSPTDRVPSEITVLPRALSTGEQGIIAAANRFAPVLLTQVNATRGQENVFIAPLSARSGHAARQRDLLQGRLAGSIRQGEDDQRAVYDRRGAPSDGADDATGGEGARWRIRVASLTDVSWAAAMATLASAAADVSMPRFSLSWEATLNEPLKALGMRSAFRSFSPFVNG